MKNNILIQTGERTETRIRTIPAQYNEMGEIEAMQALAFAPTAEDRLTDVEQKAALLHMGCTVDDDGIVRWTAQEGENDAYTG